MSKIPDPGGTTMGGLFDVIEEIGKGGYGNVYKAREKSTGKLYAIKKVKTFDPRQATPPSFFRETECLKALNGCDNILSLHTIFRCHESNCLYLVLELCDCDLSEVINHRNISNDDIMMDEQIRSYMKQILLGLCDLHSKSFVHRDIKPSNILLKLDGENNNCGTIKIGDFGLSRNLLKSLNTRSSRALTPRVATLSYRAPELLLGSTNYDQSIDVWSLGCLLFEMATGNVLFHSSNLYGYQKPSNQFNLTTLSEFGQLNKVFEICGTPNESVFSNLPNAALLSGMPKYESDLSQVLDSALPASFLPMKDLLLQMLQLDPGKRITVADALEHPFFTAPIFSHSSPIFELSKQIHLPNEQSSLNYSSFAFSSSSPFDGEPASNFNLSSNSLDIGRKNNNLSLVFNKQPRMPLSRSQKKQINDLQSLRPDKITPPEIDLF